VSAKRLEKRRQAFVPLRSALETSWKGLTRPQQRRNRLSPGLFGTWALWDHIESSDGDSISTPTSSELLKLALRTIADRGVDSKTIFESQGIDPKAYFLAIETSITQPGEFSPTCAILGGVLSQDVLNALGGREEPLVNWFQLEGLTGAYWQSWHCLSWLLIVPPQTPSILCRLWPYPCSQHCTQYNCIRLADCCNSALPVTIYTSRCDCTFKGSRAGDFDLPTLVLPSFCLAREPILYNRYC
jgi:hypothetical protein